VCAWVCVKRVCWGGARRDLGYGPRVVGHVLDLVVAEEARCYP
jgi:hypothetical protein